MKTLNLPRTLPCISWIYLLIILSSSCTKPNKQIPLAHVKSDYVTKLDPLSSEEISSAVQIFKSSDHFSSSMRFTLIELFEPEKEDKEVNRKAFIILYDWSNNITSEAIVDLPSRSVTSYKEIGETNPPTATTGHERVKEIFSRDSLFMNMLKKLDISSVDNLGFREYMIDDSIYEGKIAYGWAWINKTKYKDAMNMDILGKVNLTTGEIYNLTDTTRYLVNNMSVESYLRNREKEPIINPNQKWPQRAPLDIVQPQGPGFTIENSKIQWQNWEIHYGLNPRRGLEIFLVSLLDKGEKRKVVYRAGLSEGVTPYGDPGFGSWFPSDIGDYNFANYALQSMVPGEDAPPNATILSGIIHDHFGNPITIENAVAVYEKDGGLLWKHYEESRRARELVIASYFTVDNYDYCFQWIFGQTGSIEAKVILSGLINKYAIDDEIDSTVVANRKDEYYTLVHANVAGPVHQHFFNYRIDLDVDGNNNTVFEMNTMPDKKDNPNEEWFYVEKSPLATEQEAIRSVNVMQSRWWKISNENKQNELGQYPSYALMPMGNAMSKAGPNSKVRKRFPFLDSQFRVTAYNPAEMYSAGLYLHDDFERNGLENYASNDQDLINTDLVLWYTFGLTHLPRPEDWPYMPIHKAGFKLVPYGFYSNNPAIEIPRKNPWNID